MMQTSLAYLSLRRHLEASNDPVKQISVHHLTDALPQTAPVKGLLHFSVYVIPLRLLRKKSRNSRQTRVCTGFPVFITLTAIAKKLKSLKSVSHISVGDRPLKPQRRRGLAG
ncbi:hypothetical protein ACOSP8_004010 [Enterobacter hormaechei]